MCFGDISGRFKIFENFQLFSPKGPPYVAMSMEPPTNDGVGRACTPNDHAKKWVYPPKTTPHVVLYASYATICIFGTFRDDLKILKKICFFRGCPASETLENPLWVQNRSTFDQILDTFFNFRRPYLAIPNFPSDSAVYSRRRIS